MSSNNPVILIEVTRKPAGKPHDGIMRFDGRAIPCSLGRSGITTRKREGDGATPIGDHRLLYGYARRDRIKLPASQLMLEEPRPSDGWCDDPASGLYNQPVSLPSNLSHETLCREDRLYDVCIVLDYNITQKARHRGSAIFFHLTREDDGPTEGCVAISPQHMKMLLPRLSNETILRVIG